jgi:uncharacterized protein with WD repeat
MALDKDNKIKNEAVRDEKGRFINGYSGNPNGRPKGKFSLVSMLRKELQKVPENEKEKYADMLIEKILKKAVVDGDGRAIRDIFNMVDGPPGKQTDVNPEDVLSEVKIRIVTAKEEIKRLEELEKHQKNQSPKKV